MRAVLTALPILVAGWWLFIAAGGLWRRTVWREAGVAVREVAGAWQSPARARWAGFEVKGQAATVQWRGGLDGPVTVVRRGRAIERHPGWLTAAQIQGLVAAE